MGRRMTIFFLHVASTAYTKTGFLLLQKIMRNAHYFMVVFLLEKHGVSEKTSIPSFNFIVFKVTGSDKERH